MLARALVVLVFAAVGAVCGWYGAILSIRWLGGRTW